MTLLICSLGDDAGDNLEGPNGCSDRGCTTGWNTMGTMAMVCPFPPFASRL